ncbi:hypothetical protein WG66_010060 [Moniliophthora roreri]|nr:hypothetical protein WG66_010060 [Moniliophthora roreri]
MSTAVSCLIANPDISGIGVRLAVYAQTFLSFAPAFFFTADGELDLEEEKSLFAIYYPLLLSSMALFGTTIFQQLTVGLGNYHVLLVLNMMWMMNISAVVACVSPTLAWFRRPVPMLPTSSDAKEQTQSTRARERYFLFWRPRRTRQLLEVLFVSLCITGMSVLGLWHWSVLHITGLNKNLDDSQCFDQIRTTYFFMSFPITDKRIRALSLTFYGVMVLPVINVELIVIVVNVSAWMLIAPARKFCHSIRDRLLGGFRSTPRLATPLMNAIPPSFPVWIARMCAGTSPDILDSPPLSRAPTTSLRVDSSVHNATQVSPPSPSPSLLSVRELTIDMIGQRLCEFLAHAYDSSRAWLEFFAVKYFIAISFLCIIAIHTAIDIEISIDQNSALLGGTEEERWTFGQVLALLLVMQPALSVGRIFLEETPLGSRMRRWSSHVKACHPTLDLSWFMRGLALKHEWKSLYGTTSNEILLARFACTRFRSQIDKPEAGLKIGPSSLSVVSQSASALEYYLYLAENHLHAVNQVFTVPYDLDGSPATLPSPTADPSPTHAVNLTGPLDVERSNNLANDPLTLLKMSIISARDSVSIAQSVRFSDIQERNRYHEGEIILDHLMVALYSALEVAEIIEMAGVLNSDKECAGSLQSSNVFEKLKTWVFVFPSGFLRISMGRGKDASNTMNEVKVTQSSDGKNSEE